MTDVVLNLNCSEHAIYSRILSGCVYIIKFGLTSPDVFLRRVHKRQAKRLRKRGVNINASGFEYAVAENILIDLKVLPSPLIPAGLYSPLRQLLDIYGKEARSKFISDTFKDTNPTNMYVLQALLKTMNLLGTFENSWKCPCGKIVDGNGLSWTMVALSITSYILREKCASSGHWFVSWGQMASDVEVVKILITHWEDIKPLPSSKLPIIKPTCIRPVQTWHCHLANRVHVGTAPKEIPIFEVESLITPISFKPTKTGDFDISLYQDYGFESPDNSGLGDINLNTTFQTLDQQYMDNMESLQTVKERLDCESPQRSRTSLNLECSDPSEAHDEHLTEIENWMRESKKKENIWSNNANMIEEEEKEELDSDSDNHIANLVGNILSGCGGGSYNMWEDFTPPPRDTVLSGQHSKSYWSDYSQMTRRDGLIAMVTRREDLVSRIREVVLRTFREAREKIKSENKSNEIPKSESSLKEPNSISSKRSRILDLLVKANPIKDICDLEKLADKLYPAKTSNSLSTPLRTRKHCRHSHLSHKESKGDLKYSNPFEKPPHLIKEFVPKIKETLLEGISNIKPLEHDLKPIELSDGPYLTVPPLTYNYTGEQFYINPDVFMMTYPWMEQCNSAGYIQPDISSYQTEGSPMFYPMMLNTPNANQVSLGNNMLPNVNPAQTTIIPPIPEELQSTTPPNLSTIMMLSQLFTSIQ